MQIHKTHFKTILLKMCKNLVMIKSSGIFRNKRFTSLIDLLSLELFNITLINSRIHLFFTYLIQCHIDFLT